jgi:hypothetical protein
MHSKRTIRSYEILMVLLGLGLVLETAPGDAREGDMRTRTLRVPPAKEGNEFYFSNREPLRPNPLIKLPVGAVRPRGWLRHQLVLMSEGMTGHLAELSHWCQPEGSAWIDPEGQGNNGWEEMPYWLKGFGDLGYLLEDQRIIDEAREWIEAVLAAQREDGYFGPEANRQNKDVWPNMIMLNVLQSFHEYTGDERVLPFMARYFRWELLLPEEDLLPGSWQKVRAGDNLQSVYWLYNRTGEPWLLEVAEKIHRRTANWAEEVASWHGVNISQCFRQPAQFCQQSRIVRHLRATERNYREVMEKYGQVPGGMFGADENCRPGFTDPRQAAETCSMVEFMLSFEILAGITGRTIWLDRCEEVAFNSLPAALLPDLKGLHYLTAPNMVQLDQENKSPGVQNGGCMLAYSPGARYRCCQHNVSHGWPYFAEHLWMATHGNGLAAVLYAPSEVEVRVGNGTTVRIVEETDYPFRDTVDFTLSLAEPTEFPMMFRIPGWCRDPKISVNHQPIRARPRPSSFVMIDRTWQNGDRVRLQLPMEIQLTTWKKNHNSVSVHRGPLTYSLRIGERWQKFGGSDRWPEWEVFPTTPWNYALVLNRREPASSFEVVEREGRLPDQPFDFSVPVGLLAKGRRIENWKLEGGLVGQLRDSPVLTDLPEEDITLIPMGCARLRISAFPVAAEGTRGREWAESMPENVSASHVHDSLHAVCDGILPKSSHDRRVPRFTWWDHRGSTEWVAFRFPKPRKLARSEVYWFDDTGTGSCRVPECWMLLWKDGEAWREISNPTEYDVEPDRMNRVKFDPVVTQEIRLEAKLQEGFSGGILEWRVR